jgi:hypothetical protein
MMTSGLQLNWHCNLAADVRKTLFSRILEKISLTAGCRKFLLQRAGKFFKYLCRTTRKENSRGDITNIISPEIPRYCGKNLIKTRSISHHPSGTSPGYEYQQNYFV